MHFYLDAKCYVSTNIMINVRVHRRQRHVNLLWPRIGIFLESSRFRVQWLEIYKVCWFLQKSLRNADLPSFAHCHPAVIPQPLFTLRPSRRCIAVRQTFLSHRTEAGMLYGSVSFSSMPSQISCRAGSLIVEVALSGQVVTSTFLSVLASKEALQNIVTDNIFFRCMSGRALRLLIWSQLPAFTHLQNLIFFKALSQHQ